MDNPKLNEIRKEINSIDNQLLPLLMRRMDAAGKVADIKREAGIPVLDAQREQQILDRIRERGGAYGTALQGVYAAMMEASRALQHDALGGGQALRNQLKQALAAGNVAASAPHRLLRRKWSLFRRRLPPAFSAAGCFVLSRL